MVEKVADEKCVLIASIRIGMLWRVGERDEVDVGDSYIDQTSPVTGALLRIHEAEAKKFVLPLLLDIYEARAAMAVNSLSLDANEA